MPEKQSFTISEVAALGFEAYHTAEDGACWLFHGFAALRVAPTGERILVFDLEQLPRGPWYPTRWGEQELRSERE